MALKNIFVTGGAGFIGSNIVAAIEARGLQEIVICDEFGRGDKWLNLAKHEIADVVSPEALFDLIEGKADSVELIIHMGANSSTTETVNGCTRFVF